MPLAYKQYREALEHVLTIVLKLKTESPIRKTLTHNGYECIEDFVNIADIDIQNLHHKIFTKELRSLSLGHQNLILSFIDYYEYRTYDNETIGNGWTNIMNDDFNYFHMKDYYNFRRLREAGLVNTRPTSTTSS